MATVQEYMSVKLAITFHVPIDQACEIVAEEVKSWERANIPLAWQENISQASDKIKNQAWYSVQQKYQEFTSHQAGQIK